MPLSLPTDTQHLAVETRQYELFNRPLGQGIVRRRLYVGAAVCVVWFTVLLVVGVNPLSRLGPAVFIVPPFAVVYLGTRVGDDGRMTALRWYDALLARTPRRRRRIRNPLLVSAREEPARLRIDGQMTELHTRTDLVAVTPLMGRPPRRKPRNSQSQLGNQSRGNRERRERQHGERLRRARDAESGAINGAADSNTVINTVSNAHPRR